MRYRATLRAKMKIKLLRNWSVCLKPVILYTAQVIHLHSFFFPRYHRKAQEPSAVRFFRFSVLQMKYGHAPNFLGVTLR